MQSQSESKSYKNSIKIKIFRMSLQKKNYPNPNVLEKKISKQNQEYINNISASGYKQFHVQ